MSVKKFKYYDNKNNYLVTLMKKKFERLRSKSISSYTMIYRGIQIKVFNTSITNGAYSMMMYLSG